MRIQKDTKIQNHYKQVISQLKMQKTKTLDNEKIKDSIQYRRHLKSVDSVAAILGVSGISIEYYLVIFIQTSILFYGNPKYTITDTYNLLCYVNIALTMILSNPYSVLSIIYHYHITNKLIKIKKSNLESEGFKTHLIPKLILEILICIIVSPPYVNFQYKGIMRGEKFVYHITDIIMIISLLRCYLILRLYEHYSKWTSFKSSTICKKYGTSADVFFALKSDLKDRPFFTISIVITFLVVVFGIATMQSEKSYEGKYGQIDQLTNAEWLIVITMTTVGYGDLYPTTHFGRFFCLLACITGMFLVSAMVVAMNLASELDKDQSIAYLAIRAKNREQEWLSSAANVIKSAFRIALVNKCSAKAFENILKLKKDIFRFKRKTELNSLMDITSAEMLYDLQHKLEEKLLATKSIICDIPNLQDRCEKMKKTQGFLDNEIDKIIKQQSIILNHMGQGSQLDSSPNK